MPECCTHHQHSTCLKPEPHLFLRNTLVRNLKRRRRATTARAHRIERPCSLQRRLALIDCVVSVCVAGDTWLRIGQPRVAHQAQASEAPGQRKYSNIRPVEAGIAEGAEPQDIRNAHHSMLERRDGSQQRQHAGWYRHHHDGRLEAVVW